MADLSTNYMDDILAESMNGKRKYRITRADGSFEEVTLEDISEYEQIGSVFGAGDINRTNQAVNEKFDSGDVVDPMETTVPGFAADALAVKNQFNEQNKNFATPTLLKTVTSFNKEYTKVSGINWKNYKKLIFEVVVWYSDADIEYSFVEYDTNLVRTNVAYRLCPYITQNGTLTSCVELKAMFTSNGELKIIENQETWYIKEVKIYGK